MLHEKETQVQSLEQQLEHYKQLSIEQDVLIKKLVQEQQTIPDKNAAERAERNR